MDAAETTFDQLAAAAKLTAMQADVAWMWINGAPVTKIARTWSLQRRQVGQVLQEAARALALVDPEFWREGRQFPRDLLRAIENKADHREGNLRGVAPAHDVRTHLPKAEVFTADRRELRQCPASCLKMWGQALVAAHN